MLLIHINVEVVCVCVCGEDELRRRDTRNVVVTLVFRRCAGTFADAPTRAHFQLRGRQNHNTAASAVSAQEAVIRG